MCRPSPLRPLSRCCAFCPRSQNLHDINVRYNALPDNYKKKSEEARLSLPPAAAVFVFLTPWWPTALSRRRDGL